MTRCPDNIFLLAGEQHCPQRVSDVQRHTHSQLHRPDVQRRPGEVQALHVRRWDSVPRSGEVSQHGLPDLRQPVWESSLAPPFQSACSWSAAKSDKPLSKLRILD